MKKLSVILSFLVLVVLPVQAQVTVFAEGVFPVSREIGLTASGGGGLSYCWPKGSKYMSPFIGGSFSVHQQTESNAKPWVKVYSLYPGLHGELPVRSLGLVVYAAGAVGVRSVQNYYEQQDINFMMRGELGVRGEDGWGTYLALTHSTQEVNSRPTRMLFLNLGISKAF